MKMATCTLPRLHCGHCPMAPRLRSSTRAAVSASASARTPHEEPSIPAAAGIYAAARRGFLLAVTAAGSAGLVGIAGACLNPGPDCVLKKGVSTEEIKAIVAADVTERQFLATANFTPEIYTPDCTFTDEIDSYTYKDFVKGTQALFDASKSTVNLVGDVYADENEVSFRFDEELAFNIPFKPKTYVTGTLTLRRDEDGLIKSYTEKWDKSPADVIKTVHF